MWSKWSRKGRQVVAGNVIVCTCTTESDAEACVIAQNAIVAFEKTDVERPFSYDACPVGEDGRRRAVTRDGQHVVLVCDNATSPYPIIGFIPGYGCQEWTVAGSVRSDGLENNYDLFVPLPLKRVVWVNFYDDGVCEYFDSDACATAGELLRRGVRCWHTARVEIDDP